MDGRQATEEASMIGSSVEFGTSDMSSALVRIGSLVNEDMDVLDAIFELDYGGGTAEQLSPWSVTPRRSGESILYLQKNYGGVCRHHSNRFLAVLLNQGRMKTISD